MSRWPLSLILILSVILLLTLWQTPAPTLIEDIPSASNSNAPSSYLKNSKTTQFNDSGSISYQLLAERIDTFATTNETASEKSVLQKLHFTFFAENENTQPTWIITSDSGESQAATGMILLNGNVVIEQQHSNGGITTMHTDTLEIHAHDQYAITNKPVTIESQAGTTTADGLELSLNTKITKLLANVNSLYKSLP